MAKQLSFSNESREALEKGVNFVANAVKVTIGPKAKNVVIERKFGSPDIVRDGSTVAKVDPSLTISGEPNFLSITTFFAFGPIVTFTALATKFTPFSSASLDSLEKLNCLGMFI